MDEIAQLERAAWQAGDIECLPTHLLVITEKIGGLLLGAYEDGRLLGFSYSLPAMDGNNGMYHHLHSLGIAPQAQGRGIGYAIMRRHRELSLAQGIRKVEWTFDPLESVNANLYIRKLGAEIKAYLPDYYGELEGINAGLPTDRALVSWQLDTGTSTPPLPPFQKYRKVSISTPVAYSEGERIALEIPANFQVLKTQHPTEAASIREASGKWFSEILKTRTIQYFIPFENRYFYLIN